MKLLKTLLKMLKTWLKIIDLTKIFPLFDNHRKDLLKFYQIQFVLKA